VKAAADGESHFSEIDIPVTTRSIFPDTAPFELSAHYPAQHLRFTRIPPSMREVALHMGAAAAAHPAARRRRPSARRATARCGTFRPAASCWWRTRTARATSPAVPPRRTPSAGSRCRTGLICRPDSPRVARLTRQLPRTLRRRYWKLQPALRAKNGSLGAARVAPRLSANSGHATREPLAF
jgi:hypothetical protein